MSTETASITFYSITQCGFYSWGGDTPLFGTTSQLLTEIEAWSKGKELQQTKLYEPKGDLLPVYLLDITQHGNDWLVTIWNQVPSTEKGVASVMGSSKVGDANVVMNQVAKGSIPGFATYFWFLPNTEVFASVRFRHLITAQKAMQEYMESFLEFASSHAVLERQEGPHIDAILMGYKEDPAGSEQPSLKIYPKFRAELVKKPGKHEHILKNIEQISRVERSMQLRLDKKEDLSMFQAILRFTNMHNPVNPPKQMRFNYRLATGVTKDEVQAIIDSWNAGAEKQWDDYGFVFRGSNSIHWLSHSLAREDVDLNIERTNDEVVEPVSLLEALHANKTDLLSKAKG